MWQEKTCLPFLTLMSRPWIGHSTEKLHENGACLGFLFWKNFLSCTPNDKIRHLKIIKRLWLGQKQIILASCQCQCHSGSSANSGLRITTILKTFARKGQVPARWQEQLETLKRFKNFQSWPTEEYPKPRILTQWTGRVVSWQSIYIYCGLIIFQFFDFVAHFNKDAYKNQTSLST